MKNIFVVLLLMLSFCASATEPVVTEYPSDFDFKAMTNLVELIESRSYLGGSIKVSSLDELQENIELLKYSSISSVDFCSYVENTYWFHPKNLADQTYKLTKNFKSRSRLVFYLHTEYIPRACLSSSKDTKFYPKYYSEFSEAVDHILQKD